MRPTTDHAPLLAWTIIEDGVQVYDAEDAPYGWLSAVRTCPACSLRLVVVVPNYAMGFECPGCRYVDMTYEWGLEDVEA